MTDLLSYTHGASDVPLIGQTIGDNLRQTVGRFGDREALVVRHPGVRLTYRELWDATTRCARGLLVHRVQKGDRVGVWAADTLRAAGRVTSPTVPPVGERLTADAARGSE